MPSVSILTIKLISLYLVIIIKIFGYFAHLSSNEMLEDDFIAGCYTGLIALIGILTDTKIIWRKNTLWQK